MASDIRLADATADVVSLDERRASKSGKTAYFGGGGGGSTVDTETKNYVDASMRAVKAENSSHFTRLEAKIDGIIPGASWQQIAGIAAVTIGSVFAILAYASDRFDGGISASGLLDSYQIDQQKRDEAQDAKLDRVLTILEAQSAKPKERPQVGQD